jgi:hypothetical protein
LDVTNRLHGNHTFLLPPLLEADKIRIEFTRRIFQVKRTSFLSAFLVALALISTGCGTSDSIKSITVSSQAASSGGFYNLVGTDGTLQLIVTANYHSGKAVIVTNDATWTVTPFGNIYSVGPGPGSGELQSGGPLPPYGPETVPINTTGLMTAVAPICTWYDEIVTTGTGSTATQGPANPPVWLMVGYYQVVATYRGMTSQPVGVGVGVAASNSPTGGCGPS